MRNEWLITFRSVTFAQRGAQMLHNENIVSRLQRTPKMLTASGCGYCLRLRGRDGLLAVEILRREEIPFGKLYILEDDGAPKEWQL